MESLLPHLTAEFMGTPAWIWLVFVGIVVTLLAFDLGVLHRDDRKIGVREACFFPAAISAPRSRSAHGSGGTSAPRAGWTT